MVDGVPLCFWIPLLKDKPIAVCGSCRLHGLRQRSHDPALSTCNYDTRLSVKSRGVTWLTDYIPPAASRFLEAPRRAWGALRMHFMWALMRLLALILPVSYMLSITVNHMKRSMTALPTRLLRRHLDCSGSDPARGTLGAAPSARHPRRGATSERSLPSPRHFKIRKEAPHPVTRIC